MFIGCDRYSQFTFAFNIWYGRNYLKYLGNI